MLGHAYRNLNQLREARKALEQAARIKPGDLQNVGMNSGLFLSIWDPDAARQQLEIATRHESRRRLKPT